MGFRAVFQAWVAILYREAFAAFLLHNISPFIASLFTIWQGDPLAFLLFILYIEPFLVRLASRWLTSERPPFVT
jgi:hypothetical protein